jgi:hypothetical protein
MIAIVVSRRDFYGLMPKNRMLGTTPLSLLFVCTLLFATYLGTAKKLSFYETPKILSSWLMHLKRSMAGVKAEKLTVSHLAVLPRNDHAHRHGERRPSGLSPPLPPV